jgi:UDP-4-amino-4,6-dideoxy-N-acetyl-beta-L-altrosamine N-acetyltransferase
VPIRYADCSLAILAPDDVERVFGWRNSLRVRSGLFNSAEVTPAEHARWFASAATDPSVARLLFSIAGRPTGLVNVYAINTVSERCSLGYYVGVDDAPRGTGSALLFLGLEEAFERRGLRKVTCEIIAGNAPSLGLMRRFAFTREGRLRDHVKRDGRLEDVELYALFAGESRAEKGALGAHVFA